MTYHWFYWEKGDAPLFLHGMSHLLRVVFAIQLVGGTVFFAALWAASLSLSVKVLLGSAMLIVWSGLFWTCVHGIAAYQDTTRTISSRLLGETSNPLDATGPMQADWKWTTILFAVIAFWLVGGWILAGYV